MAEEHQLLIDESEQEFVLCPDGIKAQFRSLSDLEAHLVAETSYWERVDHIIFGHCRDVLREVQLVKARFAGQPKVPLNQLARVKDLLRRVSADGYGVRGCVYSKSPLGRYMEGLRKCSQSDNDYRQRAYVTGAALFGGTSWNVPPHGQGFSEGVACLVSLRGEKWLTGVADQYKDRIREFDEQNLQRQATLKEHEQRLEDLLSSSAEDGQKRQQDFDRKMLGFGEAFNALAAEKQQDYDEFYALASDRLAALEETYEEKLQLAAPAECWKKLSSHYFGCGVVELVAAAAIGIVLGVFVFLLLDNKDAMPWLNSGKVDFTTVRTALLLLIMTSAFGYVVHFLGRMSISSFHLSRDYSERYQLTCVYLAMKRDDSDGKSENVKSVVYQSLFSRSDTGLLKGDHAMKMPTVSELIKPKES